MALTIRALYSKLRQLLDFPPLGQFVRWTRYRRAPRIQEVQLGEAVAKARIDSIKANRFIATCDNKRTQVSKLLDLLDPTDIVWYTNAGIGIGACLLANHLSDGKVIVFEQNEERRKILNQNAALNELSNVYIIPQSLEFVSFDIIQNTNKGIRESFISYNEKNELAIQEEEKTTTKKFSFPVAVDMRLNDRRLSDVDVAAIMESDSLSIFLCQLSSSAPSKTKDTLETFRSSGYESYILEQDEKSVIYGKPEEMYTRP